jgi:hypothetical protein
VKFLPILEKGDPIGDTGKVVWKTIILYIDTEGQQHDDAPTICDHEGSEVVAPWKSGVMNCPKCGVWFENEEPELNEPRELTNDDYHDEKTCPWCVEMGVDGSVMDDVRITRPPAIIFNALTSDCIRTETP